MCELAAHPDFPQLMADLEIYVNGIAGKQVQSANAIVDAVSTTIMKQHNPGLSDPQLRQLIAAHMEDVYKRQVHACKSGSVIDNDSPLTFEKLVHIKVCLYIDRIA